MNGVKEFYTLKMKQTSKGVWHCDGLTVEHENIDDVIILTDKQMYAIETILKTHNGLPYVESEEKK